MDQLAQGYCVSAAIDFFQYVRYHFIANHFVNPTSPKWKCLLQNRKYKIAVVCPLLKGVHPNFSYTIPRAVVS